MPTNNSWNSNVPVELSKGGTNATSFGTNLGVVKYDGTRLITSTAATIDSNNIYTNTSQPRFSAYVNATVSNVTGNGAAYTIIYNTEDYDVGSNYNTASGVFTVPKNGMYIFSAGALLNGCTIASYITFQIVTSAKIFSLQNGRTASANELGASLTVQIYLTAGQTAYCTVTATGEAANTDDIFGSAVPGPSFFQGCLLT